MQYALLGLGVAAGVVLVFFLVGLKYKAAIRERFVGLVHRRDEEEGSQDEGSERKSDKLEGLDNSKDESVELKEFDDGEEKDELDLQASASASSMASSAGTLESSVDSAGSQTTVTSARSGQS